MNGTNGRFHGRAFTRPERGRRAHIASEHLLQLFDTEESLANSVSAFLVEGFRKGETLLVVATASHWTTIREGLVERELDVDASLHRGQLRVLDAVAALSRFMRRGEPNRALFRQTVGALVAELATPAGLRIYGEMVEVLACEGNYGGVSQLEDLWNQLSAEHSFTLLCGYSAPHFAAPDAGASLAKICFQHSRASCEPHDALASFLLSKQPGGAGRARVF
jgi:hypothetical protein